MVVAWRYVDSLHDARLVFELVLNRLRDDLGEALFVRRNRSRGAARWCIAPPCECETTTEAVPNELPIEILDNNVNPERTREYLHNVLNCAVKLLQRIKHNKCFVSWLRRSEIRDAQFWISM